MPTLISIGELIDRSWDVYRARATELLSISGWLITTAILFALALAFYPSVSTLQLGAELTGSERFGVVLFSLTSLVIAPILSFWIFIAMAKAVGAHLSRRSVNAGAEMRGARVLFLPALTTSIMVILMLVLAIVIGFAPAAILATIGALSSSGALIVLTNLLLIAGIFVSMFLSAKWVVYYFMAPYITILDATRSKSALAASRQLIQGRFWSVLMRIIVPKLVFIIFGVFAMSIIAYLVGIFINASAGISLELQLRIGTMTQTIVPILIAVVINPLVIISDVLLLRSLRA